MWKFRVHLALALCAGAGVCGLLAWHWDALRIGLVGSLALWFGAGAFLWKASQALLGKIGLPQEQTPAQPVVPHPLLVLRGRHRGRRSRTPAPRLSRWSRAVRRGAPERPERTAKR